MAKPEFQCPYRKEYLDPLYRSVYGEEFPGLQSDLLSNKTKFLTAGNRDYPGLKIWTHANAAAVLRARIGTIDNIIKGKFGGTQPAWLKESGGKNPGGNNPFEKAGPNKKYGNPYQSSSGKSGSNPGAWEYYLGRRSSPEIKLPTVRYAYPEGQGIGRSVGIAGGWPWLLETGDWYPPVEYKEIKWVPDKDAPRGYCKRYKGGVYMEETTTPDGKRIKKRVSRSAEEVAMEERDRMRGYYLTMIGAICGSKAAKLWEMYLGEPGEKGGTEEVQDVGKEFYWDFVYADATYKATEFLVDKVKESLSANYRLWPPEGETYFFDLVSLIGLEPFYAIDEHEGKYGMEFLGQIDVPSVIAGGIGKEVDTRYGAIPSKQPDARRAMGFGSMYRVPKSKRPLPPMPPIYEQLFFQGYGLDELEVALHIMYRVEDTVDLCPGAWGGRIAQEFTVPASQYEATGISGDVPFFIEFEAPFIPRFSLFGLLDTYPSPEEDKYPASFRRVRALYDGKSPNPGPYKKGPVKGAGNPGNPGVNPLRSFPSGKSLGWSEEEVARRAVALTAAPARTPGRREVGGAPAAAGTTRKVTCYQTVDNVTIHTGGPLDPQALRAALERFMRSEATAVA